MAKDRADSGTKASVHLAVARQLCGQLCVLTVYIGTAVLLTVYFDADGLRFMAIGNLGSAVLYSVCKSVLVLLRYL